MNLSNNAKHRVRRNSAENGAPRGKALILAAAFLLGYAANGIFSVWNVRFPLQQEKGYKETTTTTNIDKIVNGLQPSGDLFALTHYDKDEQELMEEIRKEQESGERDKYYLPKSYKARLDNKHFNDIGAKDGYQKEVYIAAMLLARRLVPSNDNGSNNAGHGKHQQHNRRGLVLDIGAGSGYKLVKFLSPEFETIGFETEPAISFLRKQYPNEKWVESGKPEESLPESWNSNSRKPDVCICSDVIEHIRDPNDLVQFLLSLQCKAYVISTPKREALAPFLGGPPSNTHHVREWTLHEFKMFLESLGFRVVKSYEGIQHISILFAMAVPDNNKKKE